MTRSLKHITTVTLNPAIDQTLTVPGFEPGEVNLATREQIHPGGKGVNVAGYLVDFGFDVAATGFLGIENAGLFEQLFAEKGIEDHFIRAPGRTRTNVKVVDDRKGRVTDINLPGLVVTAGDVAQLMYRLETLGEYCEWFALSGSLPIGVPAGIYRELTLKLKDMGKRVVVDTGSHALQEALPALPYAVKPNLRELQGLAGQTFGSHREIARFARKLVQEGVECVVVSLGEEGALFTEAEGSVLAVPPDVARATTVGAGDAMVAGLIAAKAQGMTLEAGARLASGFAVASLLRLGPYLPPRPEVEAYGREVRIERIE